MIHIYETRNRETGRKTDRETERQVERKTKRHRQEDRKIEAERDRETERQIYRALERCRDRDSQSNRERHICNVAIERIVGPSPTLKLFDFNQVKFLCFKSKIVLFGLGSGSPHNFRKTGGFKTE